MWNCIECIGISPRGRWLRERIPTTSMFRPHVCWDGITIVNHHIQGIVCFKARLLHHDFVLKRHFDRWRVEYIFKLMLIWTPNQYETILSIPKQFLVKKFIWSTNLASDLLYAKNINISLLDSNCFLHDTNWFLYLTNV